MSAEADLVLARLGEQDKTLDDISTRLRVIEDHDNARAAVVAWRLARARRVHALFASAGAILGATLTLILGAFGIHT